MGGAFEGLQVLELTWGIAGPMAGMMLADQGAIVTRIEPPDDPFAHQPGYRVWNRGKRSAVLDVREEAGREAFLALTRQADVVLDSFRPGVMERLGLDHATLAARNPRLISCSVTAYGEGNPDSDRPGYEALVAARTGSQWAQRGGIMSTGDLGLPDVEIPEGAEQAARSEGPIFPASPWMSLNGFYHTTLAIAAALVARERTGVGQHVEASMLSRAAFAPQSARRGGAVGGTWMNLRGAPRGLFECKDGRWVHQWPIKPLSVIEAAEDHRLEDAPAPDYTHRRVDPARIGMEPENIVVLFHYLPLMQDAFKKFTAEEWRKWGERVSEGVQIARKPEEALCDPLLVDDDCVVEVVDPELGPIRHLGVITELSRSPSQVRGHAPRRGQHTEELLREATADATPTGPPPSLRASSAVGPLHGVRVLDIGLALAGPYGASLLADLGADVIKIMAPWDGPWMQTGIGQMANRGKRGVLLNLAKPNGLAAFYKLVETADVVNHNMRSGVAERLGVGYDDLRQRNPSLIYCASRGFDRHRSAQNIPGTDQSGSALAGQEWEDGGCWRGGRPFFGTSMGDLGNGFLVAIGILEALFHRLRTGEGQHVGCSILGACLAASSGTYAFPDGSGPDRPKLDALQLGFHALYRLYETADGWLCLAAITQDHWQRLCDVIGKPDLVADSRFVDGTARRANDSDLAKLLEDALAADTAQHWFDAFDAAGVPVEMSTPGYVMAAADMPFITFSATPASVPGEAPEVGEHTDEVLAQLNLSAEILSAIHEECANRARG
jgi:crotonobetainyl-CoA:carnitine CoA-transferase CaiB-like acyl-CoA transferase